MEAVFYILLVSRGNRTWTPEGVRVDPLPVRLTTIGSVTDCQDTRAPHSHPVPVPGHSLCRNHQHGPTLVVPGPSIRTQCASLILVLHTFRKQQSDGLCHNYSLTTKEDRRYVKRLDTRADNETRALETHLECAP